MLRIFVVLVPAICLHCAAVDAAAADERLDANLRPMEDVFVRPLLTSVQSKGIESSRAREMSAVIWNGRGFVEALRNDRVDNIVPSLRGGSFIAPPVFLHEMRRLQPMGQDRVAAEMSLSIYDRLPGRMPVHTRGYFCSSPSVTEYYISNVIPAFAIQEHVLPLPVPYAAIRYEYANNVGSVSQYADYSRDREIRHVAVGQVKGLRSLLNLAPAYDVAETADILQLAEGVESTNARFQDEPVSDVWLTHYERGLLRVATRLNQGVVSEWIVVQWRSDEQIPDEIQIVTEPETRKLTDARIAYDITRKDHDSGVESTRRVLPEVIVRYPAGRRHSVVRINKRRSGEVKNSVIDIHDAAGQRLAAIALDFDNNERPAELPVFQTQSLVQWNLLHGVSVLASRCVGRTVKEEDSRVLTKFVSELHASRDSSIAVRARTFAFEALGDRKAAAAVVDHHCQSLERAGDPYFSIVEREAAVRWAAYWASDELAAELIRQFEVNFWRLSAERDAFRGLTQFLEGGNPALAACLAWSERRPPGLHPRLRSIDPLIASELVRVLQHLDQKPGDRISARILLLSFQNPDRLRERLLTSLRLAGNQNEGAPGIQHRVDQAMENFYRLRDLYRPVLDRK